MIRYFLRGSTAVWSAIVGLNLKRIGPQDTVFLRSTCRSRWPILRCRECRRFLMVLLRVNFGELTFANATAVLCHLTSADCIKEIVTSSALDSGMTFSELRDRWSSGLGQVEGRTSDLSFRGLAIRRHKCVPGEDDCPSSNLNNVDLVGGSRDQPSMENHTLRGQRRSMRRARRFRGGSIRARPLPASRSSLPGICQQSQEGSPPGLRRHVHFNATISRTRRPL